MNRDPNNPVALPNALTMCQIQDGVPLVVTTTYLPWTLSYWDGTQLDPVVEIGNFRYFGTINYIVNRRKNSYALNSFAWIGGSTTYIITAEPDSNGVFQPIKIGVRSGTTWAWHNITLSADEKSIASVEGIEGQTECTRSGVSEKTYRNLAYTDELPTVPSDVSSFNNDAGYITASAIPSNVSAFNNDANYVTASAMATSLAAKQDALTQTQLSVINEGVDERKTVIKYVNDDVVELDISGTIETSDIPDIGNVKKIKFGTTVTELGDQLMDSRAPYLSKVEIPDSVTNIGEYAFRLCGNLADVKFGNGLQSIEDGAFSSCDLTTVELPESLKKIYNSALAGNANLTTVYIPKYVDYIEDYIFYACPNAKIVFLDRTLEEVVNIGAYNGIKHYPWGVDKNQIYAIDSTDSYEFCTITPPAPFIGSGMLPITYSIQGVGYTVENGSELTITRTGAYYTVEHNNETLDSTVLLFTADKTGSIESYGTSIDEDSMRFAQQIIPPH